MKTRFSCVPGIGVAQQLPYIAHADVVGPIPTY